MKLRYKISVGHSGTYNDATSVVAPKTLKQTLVL